MDINLINYKSKVEGCWTGKNIGGTLGAPFECKRGVFETSYYTQELNGEPLPNDDLDLQLVWLNAIEKYGRFINASTLGEYWHSFVTPNWGEYGAGKNNMRSGLVPPLSGYVNNIYKDSCGAFILSEIWACIAPGHPEIAVKYAFEDAIVNHSREGVYAEVFCAALESAAFVESDYQKLIDIGLSYIPHDSGVAKGINNVIESYKSGLTWQEARKNLLITVPGSFGALGTLPEDMDQEIPIGEIGWDAPSNIGIIIIGLLYGEGDFGKSICIASNCGEDADCTAGTLGSILGIIGGMENIPDEWVKPLGGKIKTLCINYADQGVKIPKTVDELVDRVLKLTPLFLGSELCDFMTSEMGYTIHMLERDQLFNKPTLINAWESRHFEDVLKRSPFVVKNEFVIFNTFLDYGTEPFILEGQTKSFRLTIENNLFTQQWLNVKWYLPIGWEITPGCCVGASLEQFHCNIGRTELNFEITARNLNQSRYDLILEISSVGRHTKGLISVVLITKG
ncbi:MAG: ADP-ribosylglycohydrolase family protein [Vallitaleaceae bacterium]|nr:ADP-ribosylglycohydrolase family protein [Vallitaleaceae bacterium]